MLAVFIWQQLLFQFNLTEGSTRTIIKYEGFMEYRVVEQQGALWELDEKDIWVTCDLKWVNDDGSKPRYHFRTAAYLKRFRNFRVSWISMV